MVESNFDENSTDRYGTPVTDFGALSVKIASISSDLRTIRREMLPEMRQELRKATEGVVRLEERFDAQNKRIGDLERIASDDHGCLQKTRIATLEINAKSLLGWRKTLVVLVISSILGVSALTFGTIWKAATVSRDVDHNKESIKSLQSKNEKFELRLERRERRDISR